MEKNFPLKFSLFNRCSYRPICKIFINEVPLTAGEGTTKMGRIKPRRLKSTTEKAFEEHADDFKDNFEENKKVVTQKVDVKSKKLRNIIAGYATRLKKRENKK
jgi:small subunit ribosomal protein S17e